MVGAKPTHSICRTALRRLYSCKGRANCHGHGDVDKSPVALTEDIFSLLTFRAIVDIAVNSKQRRIERILKDDGIPYP